MAFVPPFKVLVLDDGMCLTDQHYFLANSNDQLRVSVTVGHHRAVIRYVQGGKI